MNITIFPNKTKAGRELAQSLCHYFTTKHKAKVTIHNPFEHTITRKDFLTACALEDLVILDVSIAEDLTNNYGLIIYDINYFLNLWIVSRTYLPVNFLPLSHAIYPKYGVNYQEYTNQTIQKWVENTFEKHKHSIFRSQAEKDKYRNLLLDLKKAKGNAIFMKEEKAPLATQLFTENYTKLKTLDVAKKAYERQIFISFRTKHQAEVAALEKRIEDGRYHNRKVNAIFLNNGELVFENELLTEFRIWQILSHINQDYINACQEFWIYASDDYLDSWWTVAELVTFIDTLPNGNFTKKIFVYYPDEDRRVEISHKNLPKLKEMEALSLNFRFWLTVPEMADGKIMLAIRTYSQCRINNKPVPLDIQVLIELIFSIFKQAANPNSKVDTTDDWRKILDNDKTIGTEYFMEKEILITRTASEYEKTLLQNKANPIISSDTISSFFNLPDVDKKNTAKQNSESVKIESVDKLVASKKYDLIPKRSRYFYSSSHSDDVDLTKNKKNLIELKVQVTSLKK